MLARVSHFKHHNNDFRVEMPLLVPSFSSKGFAFKRINGRKISEISQIYDDFAGNSIKNTILISAYDIFHGNLRAPVKYFHNKEIVFIDSGGYELSQGYDSTEVNCWPYKPERFRKQDYIAVLDSFPDNLPIVISNFDWETRNEPVLEQVLAAQELFNRYPKFASNFIIKGGNNNLDVGQIIIHLTKMRNFKIIGMTEKELGEDLLDRLLMIARIRAAMDSEGLDIPIHIYGGLDPTVTPLYFFVGAEIFDGISWLRYAYRDGLAIYHNAYSILEPRLGLEAIAYHALSRRIHDNIISLQQQMTTLKRFVLNKANDFRMFGPNCECFARAYDVLKTRINRLKGVE
ncbi:MAG: hypothetical protein LLF76_14935 [Planctomycetaceae bacterium]|nr:hypothetical protein [Planctomycetaceae bacterium]